ncbi:RING finger protein 24 isoform X3 [Nelusetta ayraudi]|uniref:RING finger protein 24 isoform X3 n=1 Tax=Nelusetta ayraudi TaxID=303726 RepID=UPI003F6FA5B1
MSSDFPHYSFRMPNIGFQNLPLNIYIVVFGTAIFVFILSLLFCCYLIRLRHQAHKELYAYKQVIQKEKVKELNLHELENLERTHADTVRKCKLHTERFQARNQTHNLLDVRSVPCAWKSSNRKTSLEFVRASTPFTGSASSSGWR